MFNDLLLLNDAMLPKYLYTFTFSRAVTSDQRNHYNHSYLPREVYAFDIKYIYNVK